MKKFIKKNKVYITGAFYIIFINSIIVASYIIGFKDIKKLFGF
ncbi:MAG TPA: hypothetical protein VNR61_00565 [Niallia sp.]|nr:hypothetical protein [Niallia sp.]